MHILPPDAIYLSSEATGTREWCSYGTFGTRVATGGLFHFGGTVGLTHPNWTLATGGKIIPMQMYSSMAN